MDIGNTEFAWSLYWAQDKLHSCIASDGAGDQEAVNNVWRSFCVNLSDQARVLDLATGNGAVPSALLGVNSTLRIDAVDAAQIQPMKYVSQARHLSQVAFHSGVNILDMPFQDASFDALTSQFGIEYAGIEAASNAALRVLKCGGHLGFLIHHVDSEILQGSRRKIAEMEQLLVSGGILETLLDMLRGECDFTTLERAGERYLRQAETSQIPRTASISGQVFDGINQIHQLLNKDPKKARELGLTLDLRVRAEHERLVQLTQAACSTDSMENYLEFLRNRNLNDVTHTLIKADSALIGWFVQATKS